jgi:hypothetical protein
MRGWWRFLRLSARQGWRWLIDVGNHFGAAAVVLAGLGSIALAWTVSVWWITAAYIVAVVFVSFTVGAYKQYRLATTDIGQVIVISLDATVRQLHGERGRANTWLKTLREAKNEEEGERNADTIKHLFDVFWLQTLQTIIEPRAPDLWAGFVDEVDDPLAPLGSTERERVFAKVQLTVKRLDGVIAELSKQTQEVRDLLMAS